MVSERHVPRHNDIEFMRNFPRSGVLPGGRYRQYILLVIMHIPVDVRMFQGLTEMQF